MGKRAKWLAGITAVAAMVTLIAGCSDKQEAATKNETAASPSAQSNPRTGGLSLPLSSTPVTYKFLIREVADIPVKNDWLVLKELAKKTNVNIQFEPVPSTGYEEKKKLLIATNNVPDFSLVNETDALKAGPDKVFLNLKPYIDKGLMPNVKKLMSEIPDIAAVTTAGDGGIYSLPGLSEPNWLSYSWMVRDDVMKELGLQPPKDTDDLYRMLKAMKEKNPKSFPLIMQNAAAAGSNVSSLFNVFTTMFTETSSTLGYNPFNKKYEFAPSHPQYKNMLTYLNKLYTEGLLDQEFAIMKTQNWEQRVQSGASFMTYYNKGRIDIFTDAAVKADPNTKYNMVGMAPVAAPGMRPFQLLKAKVNAPVSVALSANIKNPEIAVQFFDYLYSDEGSDIYMLGAEGVTYERVNGKAKYLPALGTIPTAIQSKLKADYGIRYNNFPLLNYVNKGRDAEPPMTKKLQELETLNAKSAIDPPPSVIATEAELSLEKSKLPSLEKYIEQKLTEFVMGKTPISDAALNDFIAQCKKLGSDELIKMYNDQLQRALKK
ncbi:extracellular solute-binding protein [Paenibacillus whitsoniae]|uniref:Extracellular solute-binding protein n=1 Tax=Paenibacillus whitsoniae TaxID=2496558 RepID=A0A430JIJ0_9BACL|nr:extracellular solute-binding protein [Paenibacillus whitsoniae]RTE10871.1 extracellular solute-binding protein [Paenibacillus whitsoniae]